MEIQVNQLLSAMIFEKLGFEDASETSIPTILEGVHPKGGTALRDSIIGGNSLILKLFQMLQKTGASNNWNFVHVVLTDGLD